MDSMRQIGDKFRHEGCFFPPDKNPLLAMVENKNAGAIDELMRAQGTSTI